MNEHDLARLSQLEITRRRFLRGTATGIGAVLAAPILAACGKDDSPAAAAPRGDLGPLYEGIKSREVVYADYGGLTDDARQAVFFSTFEEATGINVVTAEADSARFRLMAESGKSEWDSMDTDGFDVVDFAEAGLLQKLPAEVTRADMVPAAYQDYATSGLAYSVTQGSLQGTFSGPGPESWADFWNLSRFPGKRGLFTFFLAIPEIALLADGVAPEEMYPLDIPRAMAKLEEIKKDTLFFETYAQAQQMLQDETISVAAMPAQRFLQLENFSIPVNVVWNEAVYVSWTGNAIPVGAPHSDAAFAFVDWMQDPRRQAEFSRLALVGPNNSGALEYMTDDLLAKMPNSPEHLDVAFEMDQAAVAAQIGEISDAYTAFLAS
jgi:putative spermidine/putrescine transport system substrate-binding protein